LSAALRRRVFSSTLRDVVFKPGAMPADFILRPTEAGDLPAITQIYAEAVRHGTASYELEPPDAAEMARRWRDLAAKDYPHIVAVGGGAVLGYAYAGPYRPRPAYRYSVEDSIYVAPAAHGRGIGRALLAELIRTCEARGFRQMIAVIGGGTEHPASVGLHAALGFRHIGIIEGSGFKHGRWLDTVLMQRALGPGKATLPDEGLSR
jgi:L-amino acid N-acyltransferase YncA